jgi:hypothetical protein
MATKTVKKATVSRGSAQLAARFGKADIDKLKKTAEVDGVTLIDWFPNGIPAPDGVAGVWRAKPQAVAALIDRLLKMEKVPGLRIFPRGIPKPDHFDVIFEAGSSRRG